MCKSFTILILIVTFSVATKAQKVVEGQILDFETKESIIGASIIELNIENPGGTISDLDGKFKLETKAPKIEISYTGYQSQIIEITEDTSLSILLVENNNELPTVLFIDNRSKPDYQKNISAKTLNTKDLNINNNTIITPALNRVPGVYMQSGTLNTNRITIRGIGNRSPFSTTKIKAYIDDIPLTNGSGETTIEDIDLSILGDVNVLKGPTSSIYGAGLGGMIYLATPESFQPKTEFSSDNTFGSYGLIRNVVNFSHSTEGKNLLNVNANNTFSDGYRDNNSYNRAGFNVFGKFKLNDKESISAFGNYTSLYAQIPSSLDSTDYVNNPQKAAPTWKSIKGHESYRKGIVGTTYKSIIGDHFTQSSSVYMTFRNTFEVRPFNVLRENNFMFGGRTEWTYYNYFSTSNNYFEIKAGADLFNEKHIWLTNRTIGANTPGDPEDDIQETRQYYDVFSQMKFDFHKHTSITAGINFNSTTFYLYDYRAAEDNGRTFPDIWSPFLSIGHKLGSSAGWKNDLSVHAKISQGFSPPTLEETLNPDGNINPDILPEQGWNFEIGSCGNLFQKLNYNFSVYSMQIKDLLVARRVALDQYVGINAGKTAQNGFEIELDYPFNIKSANFKTMVTYTFADYKFKEFVDGDDDFSGNQLTGAPRHLFNAGIEANIHNFYGNIQYNFVSEIPMNDSNSAYSDAYQLMNFKVGYLLKLGKKWSFNFYGGINNVWNEKYASMIQINASGFLGQAPRYYYPGLPTNFYGGITIALNLK